MRVLCSTPPMEGAFGPFVALGQALTEAGHEVVVATGPDLQARVADAGFAGEIAGPPAMAGAIAAMADPTVQSAGPGERWRFPAAMFGGVIAPRKLPALRDLADAFSPDLVLHPPVDLAGPLLAAERGLPSVCYGFLHPLEPQVVTGIADRVAALWEDAGLAPDPHAGLYRGLYLDPCPAALRARGDPVVGTVESIRTELPGDPCSALPDWADKLGARPTLYVSLGTVPLFNQPARFGQLLEELVREDIELIVTVSELHDPAALGQLPPTVHVEQWLELAPLLPRCDAVLCRAGSGTTLAALTAGLPLVLVPDGADQFINAMSCQTAGVARTIMPDELTPAHVRDAVRTLIEPGSVERAAAQRTANEIAALLPASEVANHLQALVGVTGPGCSAAA